MEDRLGSKNTYENSKDDINAVHTKDDDGSLKTSLRTEMENLTGIYNLVMKWICEIWKIRGLRETWVSGLSNWMRYWTTQ